MMKQAWVAVVTMFGFAGLCSCCLWSIHEHPRFSYAFDIGDRRTVCIWSIRQDAWFEPNPLLIHYRIDRHGHELAHTTLMESDDGGEYLFEAVIADGGRLACVYEVNRGSDNCYLCVLYDAASGESWPRDGTNFRFYPEVKKKWRERFARVNKEHPEVPVPQCLTE